MINSKQRPRKLTIYGSDGREYQFLLKGHEDLRQDERVMQVRCACAMPLDSVAAVVHDASRDRCMYRAFRGVLTSCSDALDHWSRASAMAVCIKL